MDAINVLITMQFPGALIEKLAAISPRLSFIQRPTMEPDELKDVMPEIDVLYTWNTFPDPADAPRLRWVQIHSAGADRILDEPLYTQTDVLITTVSGIHVVTMGEYVLGMLLAFAHRLPLMMADKAEASWPENRWERYLPDELRGTTLGIVGYGSVGREIARLAQPFGMRILAMKHNLRELVSDDYTLPATGDPHAEIPDRLYPPVALKSFLGECDYVVLTVPLNKETHHLINAAALGAMKPGAVLINVARGPVVDEKALIHALRERQIAGAGLDVFEEEPLPADSPLWTLPNVIISPHISGYSPHYDERSAEVFAENLRRFIAGEALINQVDRSRGY
jgi:phosphoglycerate dehydrogenase-like enzyme